MDMRPILVLIVSGALWSTGASFGAPKTVQAPAKAFISPLPQPNGDLIRPPEPAPSERVGMREPTTLEIAVDTRGAITDITVLRTSGSPQLDSAAVENARKNWKFFPAMRKGMPIASRRVETISWSDPQPAK